MIEKPQGKQMKAYETEEGLAYLVHCYRDRGMVDEDVANEIGITSRTLYNWQNRSIKIHNAIRMGKRHIDVLVENKLLETALKGNLQAMIFWLRNRKSEQWTRDIRPQEIESDTNIIIVDEWSEETESDEEDDN